MLSDMGPVRYSMRSEPVDVCNVWWDCAIWIRAGYTASFYLVWFCEVNRMVIAMPCHATVRFYLFYCILGIHKGWSCHTCSQSRRQQNIDSGVRLVVFRTTITAVIRAIGVWLQLKLMCIRPASLNRIVFINKLTHPSCIYSTLNSVLLMESHRKCKISSSETASKHLAAKHKLYIWNACGLSSNTVTAMADDGDMSRMKMRDHKVSFTHSSAIILLAFWVGAVYYLIHLILPLPVMDLLKRTQLLTLRFSQVLTNCEM